MEDQIHPFLNDLYSVSREQELSFAQAYRHRRNLRQNHRLNFSVLRCFAFGQKEEQDFSAIREDLKAVLMKFALLAVSDRANFRADLNLQA